ncbi:MAG: hypothetical protein R3E83_15360 [Burkholderiaceae bacterium]
MVTTQLASLDAIIPPQAMEIMRDRLTAVAGASDDRLGIALVLSFRATLWSPMPV